MIELLDKPTPEGYLYDLAVVTGRLNDADIEKLLDLNSPRTVVLNVFNGWDGDFTSAMTSLSEVGFDSLDVFGAVNSNFNVGAFDVLSDKARARVQHLRLAGQFVGNLCLDMFPNLSNFGMGFTSKGRSGVKINWGTCQNLRILGGAWSFFPSIEVLSQMPLLNRIESVRPGCTPESLCDIKGLEWIDFSYWSQLNNFSQFGSLARSIKRLELYSASKIRGYEEITGLSSLKFLSLQKCPPIPRGSIFSSLKEIEELHLAETKIIDGDMACLYSLPRLKKISLVDQKNLSPRRDALYKHFE
jgi:hypothetical protein